MANQVPWQRQLNSIPYLKKIIQKAKTENTIYINIGLYKNS